MSRHHLFKRALALVILVFGAAGVHATSSVCVTTGDSAGLKKALSDAASGVTGGTVLVEQGTYTVPATGWSFDILPGRDFSVLGGYVPGTNCQTRHITASPSTLATNTVLDGQNQNGATLVFQQQPTTATQYYGKLTFEGFEVRHLKTASGTAFSLSQYGGGSNGIVFRYNWVHWNSSSNPGVLLYTTGPVHAVNNLIEGNTAGSALYLYSSVYNAAPWHLVHNTVTGNTGAGVELKRQGTWVQMFSNIVYGNSATDVIAEDAMVELHGDTYGSNSTFGTGTLVNRGYAFAATNPGLDATFHLSNGSNSINSGAAFGAVVPAQDLDGNPRWVGSNPDRGAFETSTVDQAVFVVTSASDSSHAQDANVNCNIFSPTCTLREAIVRANAAGASRIDFHLGSTCGPQAILLHSPLPSINVPLLVDGFSQPGASANTVALQSGTALDEKLCVVLFGNAADNVASAFVVGPTNYGAQLEVRGITFEEFTGHAVAIAQGSYHWIHGNSFGLETSLSPFVVGNAAGISLYGGSFLSTIGGDTPADVNVFAKMTDANAESILLSSSDNGHLNNVVANNIIGLDFDQSTAVSNQGTGLTVVSKFNEIYANEIVANGGDGIELLAASDNWIHNNQIGSLPEFDEVLAIYANLGSGIELKTGTSQNAIGTFDGTGGIGFANEIVDNKTAGIWIGPNAGIGNTVIGNFISANNGGLAIDLGVQGYGVGSSTANDKQAPPTLNAGDATSYVLDPDEFYLNYTFMGGSGTNYRIDFYGSTETTCAGNPAEHDLYWYQIAGTGGPQTTTVTFMSSVYYGSPPLYVTATATNLATGDTSEISNCIKVKKDRIFANDFEMKSFVGT